MALRLRPASSLPAPTAILLILVSLVAPSPVSLWSQQALASAAPAPFGVPRGGEERPRADYYTCLDEQRGSFSSPAVEERIKQWLLRGRAPGADERLLSFSLEGGTSQGSIPPLRFLLLAVEREQLTKGRLHLAEAARMAQDTGRVFVLPHVGQSRIGLDRDMPLCSYFDVDRLGEFVDWVTFDKLREAVPELDGLVAAPGSGALNVLSSGSLSLFAVFLIKPHQPCSPGLWNKLEAQGRHPLQGLVQGLFRAKRVACVKENAGQDALLEALGLPLAESADLVLVFKNADHILYNDTVLQEAQRYTTFAPHLWAAVDQLLAFAGAPQQQQQQQQQQARQGEQQPQWVAVQWRTEYALQRSPTQQQMLDCAAGLVAFLQRKLQEHSVGFLFLAADLDSNGTTSSTTFHRVRASTQAAARAAMAQIYGELRPVTWAAFDSSFPLIDSGLQGILDKLVCLRAPSFVYAPPECGGQYSSFTRSIIIERKARGLESVSWRPGGEVPPEELKLV